MTEPVKPGDTVEERKPEDEFTAFDELARRLVQVPKSELDEQRRKRTA